MTILIREARSLTARKKPFDLEASTSVTLEHVVSAKHWDGSQTAKACGVQGGEKREASVSIPLPGLRRQEARKKSNYSYQEQPAVGRPVFSSPRGDEHTL